MNKVRYNLGCGGSYLPGYINVDHPAAKTRHDLPMDLDEPAWPLGTASADELLCNDTLEHLQRPDRAMLEMARILKPGGRLIGQVPYAKSDGAYQCMEHRWFFTEKSFDAFCVGAFAYPIYGRPPFKAKSIRLIDGNYVSAKTRMRNAVPRRLRLFLTNFLWNMFDGVAFELERV